jgi:hypothetical protein
MIGVKLSCIVLFAGLGCAASVDSASMAELQAVRFKTATGGHKSNFQA